MSLAFPKDGQVKTTFLAIRELPDGKADTITNKMVAVAEELQLDLLHKLSGMCKGWTYTERLRYDSLRPGLQFWAIQSNLISKSIFIFVSGFGMLL